jgi:hypothetical protein
LKLLVSLVVAVILFQGVVTNLNAEPIRVVARYGGTMYGSAAQFESLDFYSSPGGSFAVGLDVSGPEVDWKLQPYISFDYHWIDEGDWPLINQSEIYSLGLLRAVGVGYAEALFFVGAAYFDDFYVVEFGDNPKTEHNAVDFGVSFGLDLRLKFFERVDIVLGYEYLGREKPAFSEVTENGRPYSIVGRGVDHCMTAGISVAVFGI